MMIQIICFLLFFINFTYTQENPTDVPGPKAPIEAADNISNNISKPVVQTTSGTALLKLDSYSFDYKTTNQTTNQNDCWDVNDVKTSTGTWNGVSYKDPSGNTDPALAATALTSAQKYLCENMFFYIAPDDKTSSDCPTTKVGDEVSKDPVCLYYKAKYEDTRKAQAAAIKALFNDPKADSNIIPPRANAVAACQWLPKDANSGTCVPRDNAALSHYVRIDNIENNPTFCSKNNFSFNPRTCISYAQSSLAKLKIITKFLYFLENKDKGLLLKSPVNDVEDVFRDQPLKDILKTYSTMTDAELNTALAAYLKGDNLYTTDLCQFNTDKLASVKSAKARPTYAAEIEEVPCSKFVEKKDTNPDVINVISNAKRDGELSSKNCSLYVLFLKKIIWSSNKVKPDEDDSSNLSTKARQLFGLRITRFIYNDNLFSFIPVHVYSPVKKDNEDTYNKYQIMYEDKLFKLTDRFGAAFCSMVNRDFEIKAEPFLAKAAMGFYDGRLISKGDMRFTASNKYFPFSTPQFAYIKKYCSSNIDPAVTFDDASFMSHITTLVTDFNAAYKAADKAALGALGTYLNSMSVSDSNFYNSKFYTITNTVLKNTAGASAISTLPPSYTNELLSFLSMPGYENATKDVGSPTFFYVFALHAGVDLTNSAVYPIDDKWITAKFIVSLQPKWTPSLINQAWADVPADFPTPGVGNAINGKYFYYHTYSNDNGYRQSLTPIVTGGDYIMGLMSMLNIQSDLSNYLNNYTVNGEVAAAINANVVANGGSGGTSPTGAGTGKFGTFLKNTFAGSGGAIATAAISAILASNLKNIESQDIKDQLAFSRITARMNECSSLDCHVKADFCKLEKVDCITNSRILGIKMPWKKRKDKCEKDEAAKAVCDKFCDGETLKDYPNPYTGEIEKLNDYQICLRNVTNSLLQKNPCFDLVSMNMKNPNLVTTADIRNCFLNRTPTPSTNNLTYGAPNFPKNTANVADKAPDAKKADAATAGAPSGGASSMAPTAANQKEKPKDDDKKYGSYKSDQGLNPRFVPSANQFGGSYNAADAANAAQAGTAPVKNVETADPTIKLMSGRHLNITRDKIR